MDNNIQDATSKGYKIEIEKIFINNDTDNKSMLIKVKDQELLEKTGGIVQGMSGCPVIQNGKFIRSGYKCDCPLRRTFKSSSLRTVTHVFVP